MADIQEIIEKKHLTAFEIRAARKSILANQEINELTQLRESIRGALDGAATTCSGKDEIEISEFIDVCKSAKLSDIEDELAADGFTVNGTVISWAGINSR